MGEDSSNKGLYFFMGVLLTIAIITAGIQFWNKTQPFQKSADSSLTDLSAGLMNNKYVEYDNTNVSGTQSMNAIRMNASDTFTVTVKTLRNSSGKVYVTPTYNITDISDMDYIEPSGRFDSIVGKTENGTINSITLKQTN